MKTLQNTKTIVRYKYHDTVSYGIVEYDEIIQLSSNFTEVTNNELKYDGVRVKFSEVEILAPVAPSKIVNFGWTYADQAKETGGEANRAEPFLFLSQHLLLFQIKGKSFFRRLI
ncbi:DUF2437 domain-containing protein [Evansella halocellulosilytica]|uniref:DUF2437 domain-containing protein n=1 Tax=Evansella halocellulosilytica TaxID=2011013 RepID=UPI00211B9CF2|nr:DUF2437 domain-containing protein [Evansella halocellulosilytica]